MKKATVENINAVTPTKPLKLYAHDGTYGFIDAHYVLDTNDQQIRFFTNNRRGIYLSNLNDDKPHFWDGTNSHEMVYLKESWVSGASWYRLYSDNWLEQGGVTIKNKTSQTISLIKPYSSSIYSIIIQETEIGSSDTDGVDFCALVRSMSTTNFSISCVSGNRTGMWMAYGYAA